MIHAIGNSEPDLAQGVFVAWNAEVAGQVSMGPGSSVWFSATLRADVAPIRVGRNSNLQDGVVVHVDEGLPCVIGDDVTVGHRAILHGCQIGDGSLIGMGAIVLDRAQIGAESLIGAGALVTQGKTFPPRSLILGSPARLVRQLSDDEAAGQRQSAAHYADKAARRADYRPLDTGASPTTTGRPC